MADISNTVFLKIYSKLSNINGFMQWLSEKRWNTYRLSAFYLWTPKTRRTKVYLRSSSEWQKSPKLQKGGENNLQPSNGSAGETNHSEIIFCRTGGVRKLWSRRESGIGQLFPFWIKDFDQARSFKFSASNLIEPVTGYESHLN